MEEAGRAGTGWSGAVAVVVAADALGVGARCSEMPGEVTLASPCSVEIDDEEMADDMPARERGLFVEGVVSTSPS